MQQTNFQRTQQFSLGKELMVKWRRRTNPDTLIMALRSRISLSSAQQITFYGEYESILDALYEKVEHSFNLDQDLLFYLFRDAISETFIENSLLGESVKCIILKKFRDKCNKKNLQLHKFVLITSISLINTHSPGEKHIGSSIISFQKEIPQKYRVERENILSKHPEISLDEEDSFLFACVTVDAPNSATAILKALEILDVIRSLWQIGFRKSIQILASRNDQKYRTDSVIRIGKVYTLHSMLGLEVDQNLWLDQGYRKSSAITIENFDLTESLSKRQLESIKNSSFEDKINEALVGYVRALDSEQELRFMKLWAVLEQLLGTDETEALIKRISFFYADRTLQKAVLESLRHARNTNAHVGKIPINLEFKNYQICQYIEWILKVLIDNPFRLKSFNELKELTSSTTDSKSIEEQINILLTVKKFINANSVENSSDTSNQ